MIENDADCNDVLIQLTAVKSAIGNAGKEIAKELILQNHSRVMYDHSLIPKEQIREQVTANES